MWALPVVAALPLWAFGFAGTMQQPAPVDDPVPIAAARLYRDAGCAGCHGPEGGGQGGAYRLADGEVLETFPAPIDHMIHVARGSSAIADQPYGAERDDGRRVAGSQPGRMPAHHERLTQLEVELVVFHERVVLSGEETTSPAYEAWIDSLGARLATGDETAIELEVLLSCGDPAVTPGASGSRSGSCPGPLDEGAAADGTGRPGRQRRAPAAR